jgi:hypothetical protein
MAYRSNSARLLAADPVARPTRLILVEDSARWPLVSSTRPIETMVIAQSGDPYEAFGARALRKLASLTSSGRPVRSAFFAVGHRTEAQAERGRHAIARAIATHIDGCGGGELVFVSQPSAASQPSIGADARSFLVTLVDGLLAELGSDGVSISIQFGAPAPPRSSGVRAASRSGTRLKRVLP